MKNAFFFFVFFLVCFYGSGVRALSDPESFNGKTFDQPGPNCFATALRLSGFYPTFRAVGSGEFENFLKLFCEPVDMVRRGDLGVFISPGFGPIHAFLYLGANQGIQKPGVDYAGQTAVQIRTLDQIRYTYEASPECRRFSQGDLSSCSNRLIYYRCDPETSLPFPEYRKQFSAFESQLSEALEREDLSKETFQNLEKQAQALEERFLQMGLEENPYFLEQLKSLKAQIQFFR